MDKIVNQSNLYASQITSQEKYDEWDKISVQDLKDKIYVCGTVCVNRCGWPTEFKNKTKKYIKDKLQLEKR